MLWPTDFLRFTEYNFQLYFEGGCFKRYGGGLFRVHNRKISTTQTTIKIRMIRKLDKTANSGAT